MYLVPLLTIGTQGGKAKVEKIAEEGPRGKPRVDESVDEVAEEKNIDSATSQQAESQKS